MSQAAEIEEAAARWIVRQEGGDWSPEDDAALASWLDERMAHKAAFWRLRHGWAEADRVAALGFQLGEPRARRSWRHWARSSRTWPRVGAAGAIAAALALTVGITGLTLRTSPDDPTQAAPAPALVQTPVGIQRTIALRDGSKIELNTATAVRTAAGANPREVWLEKGEAYFDIVHRPDAPFVVHAGPRTVTVLGTRFIVRRDDEKVTVAVLSGRVRVEDASKATSARATVIGQGDIAFAQSNGALLALAAPGRVDAMAGWRDGVLVFNNQRLEDAVADFNRYTKRPIRIADPAVANIRIGGTFQIDNSAGFLDLLHTAYGLQVRPEGDSIVVAP